MNKCMNKGAAFALALLVGAASCSKKAEAPIFPLSSCRHVDLIDAASGEVISGAEDIAFDKKRMRLIVSAYNRRAVEQAAGAGAATLPNGGIYSVALDDLQSGADYLKVAPLISPDLVRGGLRPHGIDFDAAADEVVFINRAYDREGRRWRMTPSIMRIALDGALREDKDAPPCSANGVAVDGEDILVSFDHAACDWRAGVENIFGEKKSGFVSEKTAKKFVGARFANGLARLPSGEIALAATREQSVLMLEQQGKAYSVKKRMRTPGSPDNLSVDAAGRIIAALHPSLISIALERKLGVGRSASRAVRIDAETGEVDLLFDDPKAKFISAATVAVEAGGDLVLGSVIDDGIVFCRGEAGE
ncbi:MAG: hypothetical protein R3C60_10440 [Parvularculaceae bacterium]